MSSSYVINIKDICISTYTNTDGQSLKEAVAKVLSSNDDVIISFHGIDAVSTSFLNSSFGELVNDFGLDVIKKRVKITNYTKTLIESIKEYINSVSFEFAD